MNDTTRSDFTVRQECAVMVGVILPRSTADPRDPLGELASLAATAGAKIVGQIMQKRQRVDSGTYVGSGKAVEIAALAAKMKADVILFDNELTPGQIGSLERIINERAGRKRENAIKVLDRSELILDIFATRARTHEAKLQVELAQLQYTYPRLTRMWAHLERIAGGAPAGIGTRGPGEQQLEIDRRLVRGRIADLKRDIATVQERKSREVARRTQTNFTVCIVGYTNAGKSTLFNTLVGAGTYADDLLFATLDTKTRVWKLDRGCKVMLSDTVGFVRDLPHHLVASFRATLEEAVHADLLLHVLDVGHPHAHQQLTSVRKVLKEVGATGNAEILLLNKIDTKSGAHAQHEWRTLNPGSIPISAETGAGVPDLHEAVIAAVHGQQLDVTLEADSSDGRLVSFIEAHAQVRDRVYENGRVRLQAAIGRQALADLSRAGAGVQVVSVRDVN